MSKDKLSIYISYILRHNPDEIKIGMSRHGWVRVDELIAGINTKGKYKINLKKLEQIVKADEKGRYKFSEDKLLIKACQGHSIPWVIPELRYCEPPTYLYHGTNTEALEKILHSGHISKMARHAVHMQDTEEPAWKSAFRWHKIPVVLKIAAKDMYRQSIDFGVSDNNVWCTEDVPIKYIAEIIHNT